MTLITYISVDIIFNNFGTVEQAAPTVFSNVNPRKSQKFTQVAALGKIKEYSRIEPLHSFFRRY